MNSLTIPSYRMSFKAKATYFALLAVGILCLHLTFTEDSIKGWFSYLIGSVFFLGFGLCGLFFTAIQHISSAKWSVSLRRVMEAMALSLPIAGLLGVGIYFGIHHIYEWSHSDAVQADALLQWKAPYLNENFFLIRLIAYFVIWIGCAIFLIRNSFKQDQSGDEKLTVTNRRASALVLILFALSVTLAGFDILKSLEPHWFSTMFGVHFFAGFFQAGLAMMILFAWALYRSGVLSSFINIDHFYEMAKFLYGFSIFWGYIAFCEFLLIWYADLPEETFWYIQRMSNGWACVAVALLVLRLFTPMLAILPYGNKRNFKILLPVCAIVILGQWLELYWIAMPAMRFMKETDFVSVSLGWKDLGIALGFVSLFVLSVGLIMEKIRMVPAGDPDLEASVHHHV